MTTTLPAGVILAGGRSRRMGVASKALAELNGVPLIRHVVERLQPQVSSLIVSVDEVNPAFEAMGFIQAVDPRPGQQGPLGGLLAALEVVHEDHEWLLLTPCDAPFLPTELGERLHQLAAASGLPGCMVRYEGELQPTFSLWHRRLLPELRHAVSDEGLGGFKQFLGRVCLSILDWEAASVPPFFNVNTPQDLARARSLLAALEPGRLARPPD